MPTDAILAGLFVFAMRVADMSLDTLRMLFMMRGKKLYAGLIGATQATVFILAVSQVLSGPLNFWTVLGYALGFGVGVVLGMMADERLAIGYSVFRIYSPTNGAALANALREAGHAATEFTAQGKDGVIMMITCIVERKQVPRVRDLLNKVDSTAFVTLEDSRPLQHGYFRH